VIDPTGSGNRGLLSLLRHHHHNLRPDQQIRLAAYLSQHPALELIDHFKQRLCLSAVEETSHCEQCAALVPRFLRAIHQLRHAGLGPTGPARSNCLHLVSGNRSHAALHSQ
jgi:NMD protein affecting ribosome stability and mRNA decay